jgi:hypothetical protein
MSKLVSQRKAEPDVVAQVAVEKSEKFSALLGYALKSGSCDVFHVAACLHALLCCHTYSAKAKTVGTKSKTDSKTAATQAISAPQSSTFV